DAVRDLELGCGGRAAVPAVAGLARAGNGRDPAGLRIDPAHHVIHHLHEVHSPVAVEADFVRLVQLRFRGRAAVARVALSAAAGDRLYHSWFSVEPEHPVVADLGDVQGAVRAGFDAEGLANVYFPCRPG